MTKMTNMQKAASSTFLAADYSPILEPWFGPKSPEYFSPSFSSKPHTAYLVNSYLITFRVIALVCSTVKPS